MLVTFRTKAYSDIMMFGDVAIQLLQMMGHSGGVPGALLAKEVPAALAQLKKAIEARKAATPKSVQQDDDEQDKDKEPAIDLGHRALPLIELLEAAAAAKVDVMWDR
jgi:malonyl CoA-acyl carrier protein transacylase